MPSGDTLLIFTPLSNEPPTSVYAQLDQRNGHTVLDFDQSTDEYAFFGAVLPRNYSGGGITVSIYWMASGVASNNVVWNAAIERHQNDVTDLDSDSFATAQAATDAAPTVDGEHTVTELAFTNGSQMDSLAAGESFRLSIARDANNGSDTMAADAELLRVEIRET